MFSYLQTMSTGEQLLELLYALIGLVALYTGVKNLRDPENPHRVGTFVFWGALGVLFLTGNFLLTNFRRGDVACGVLVAVMALPAMLGQVSGGSRRGEPTEQESAERFRAIGVKIFLPALAIGGFALLFAVFTEISALVGVGAGVLAGIALTMAFDRRNTPAVFLNDSRRLLDMVGALSMLPMLLGGLGAVFTAAGVGEVIAGYVGRIIPEGNVNVGIVVFALAMALFTIVMGNAFAAITVITVGVGAPFVLAHGADPALIGMVALTCGYCGTLVTPMAANFNITSVAVLEMRDRYGVIRRQLVPAILILLFQIGYMLWFR